MRVLIAYDGSDGADSALDDLKAKRLSVDCIFLGSTGVSNRLQRFLLGSVSAAVANRAECSVEIVRNKSCGTRLKLNRLLDQSHRILSE